MFAAEQPKTARHTVHKIGGTSMSEVDAVMNNVLIGDRTGDDLYNRIFVVSAYGGITNMLLENKKTGEPGVYALYAGSESEWAWGDALTNVAKAMADLNAEIFTDTADLNLANAFVQERVEGTRSCLMDLHRLCTFGHFKLEQHLLTVREMLSAIGEAHSAHNTMLLLRRQGIDAVFVDLSGWREQDQSLTLDERIEKAFDGIDVSQELPIVTGYAQCSEGQMKLYGRGYSEVTFARIASLSNAKEALIHKEYHLSSADPKIVGANEVRPIGRTNYDVADQLSNMGMEAIHPRAAKGLRQKGIPLRVVNTFEPDHAGTIIEDDWVPENSKAEIVTGLDSAYEVEIFDQDMVGIPGADEAAQAAFKRFKVSIVTSSVNANTRTYYVHAPLKQVRRCVDAIGKDYPDARINTRKVSIVSVIGANLKAAALMGDALERLKRDQIEVLASFAPSRGIDMQFVLSEGDFKAAVSSLHAQFVGQSKNTPVLEQDTKATTELAA